MRSHADGTSSQRSSCRASDAVLFCGKALPCGVAAVEQATAGLAESCRTLLPVNIVGRKPGQSLLAIALRDDLASKTRSWYKAYVIRVCLRTCFLY